MHRALALALLAVLLAQVAPAVAFADDGPPKPTPPATPAPVLAGFTPEQYAQAKAIADATSLSVRIDAERALAAAERAFVADRVAHLRADREQIASRIATLQLEDAARQQELDRLVQQRYRESQRTPLQVLLSTGSVLSALVATDAIGSLADAQHKALAEVQRVQAELEAQRAELAANEADLASLADSLAAKDALLATLGAQAERLAKGGGAAEVRVLKDLVDAELASGAKVDELVAKAAAAAGAPALRPALAFVWPAKGPVTQGFGPSAFGLEPPRTYHGVPYPHFHDGVDIAAPLGSPVFAAAAGQVVFVGHLPDGAEVVLIAHDGGLFTLYAHLDDARMAPHLKLGDAVTAGEPIGVVGLTGITTGAHLHFVIRRGDEPIDPTSLLPRS